MCGRYSLAADLEDIQRRFEFFDSELTSLAQVQHRAHAAGAGCYERRRETARVPALGAYSFLGRERLGGQPPYQCSGRDRDRAPQLPYCIGEAAVSGPRRWFLRMAEGRKCQKAHAGFDEVGRRSSPLPVCGTRGGTLPAILSGPAPSSPPSPTNSCAPSITGCRLSCRRSWNPSGWMTKCRTQWPLPIF